MIGSHANVWRLSGDSWYEVSSPFRMQHFSPWRPQELQMGPPCDAASLALLYDDQLEAERYWCPASSEEPLSQLHASASHALRRLARAGTSFYFVGDSVTAQHFRSVACALGILAVANTSLASDWKCFTCLASPVVRSRICFTHGGSRVRTRHGTYAELPVISKQGSFTQLIVSRILTAGDILLLNEGVHFRHFPQPAPQLDPETRRINEIASGHSVLEGAMKQGARVIWREVLAQHFNTSQGLFPSSNATSEQVEQCVPHASASPAAPDGGTSDASLHAKRPFSSMLEKTLWLNGVLQAALPNLTILPAFAASAAEHGRHFGTCEQQNKSRPSHRLQTAKAARRICDRPVGDGQSRGIDCTHWCEQSAVFRNLNVALVALLQNGGSRLSLSTVR